MPHNSQSTRSLLHAVDFDYAPQRFTVYTSRDLDRISQIRQLPESLRFEMKVVSSVMPFRVNEYVLQELIDWDRAPDDAIFQLVFPQRGMLSERHFNRMATAIRSGIGKQELLAVAKEIRADLNPHPAGQLQHNLPYDECGEPLHGLQHKYRETVLFFPSQGQTCHSYCTFCFRWAQFIGDKELRMATTESERLYGYLHTHPEVTDLLVTGGDPMVMKSKQLKDYLEPLLHPQFSHIQTIRIGTKALTFWPQRFITDEDADELIELLHHLALAGKHVAIMAHYNHWRELSTDIARAAIRRLRDAGVEIRSQGPLLAHINDHADDWARLWNEQVKLGIVPYYMFVERDTGARRYFEVPLHKAWQIYRDAMKQVSGLGRTARGPSMSADPGKVEIQGITEINGEKVFVLRFIQARDPDWVQQPFFAQYDERATWFDQLKPVSGLASPFFKAAKAHPG
ncbi:MAG: lysine 2,3-aminomutase [Candidatus Thiodiazotropha sp. (ex Epidulcina cf. delphinae)]|nr:lysine 2,3-aminomutase [Candidatus Thiodiazotropha sp. (ex Epidulcina cf. delphinae)]